MKISPLFINMGMILFMLSFHHLNANPIEAGLVNWGRDLNEALAKSHASQKPVMILFQEIPGCSGCQKFGKEVLSQPLLIEAIENEFIPLLVYNNRSGQDRSILEQFNEPAWNYQVIRFINSKQQELIARKDGVWTISL